MNEENRQRDLRKTMRILSVALAAFVVVALAIVFWLVPFRAMLPALAVPARAEGELRLHFLDVGEGDCTLVEFPDGEVLVADAGDGSFLHTEHLVRYLKGLGSPRLTLLATHTDSDHAGGLAELIGLFEVEALYLPLRDAVGLPFTTLKERAEEAHIPTEILTRYGTIEHPSGAYAVCINPRSLDTAAGDNATSAVLYLSYSGVNVLLGADIPAERERLLMREYSADPTVFDSGACTVRLDEVDILRVSHHGSAYSSTSEWLELLQAEVAVISCGRGNPYKHPSSEAVGRLARAVGEIYRIDECGDVIVSIKGGNYTVSVRTE